VPVKLGFCMQRTTNVQNMDCCFLIEWDLHLRATLVFECDTINV